VSSCVDRRAEQEAAGVSSGSSGFDVVVRPRCSRCGATLATDNHSARCSPCVRSELEHAARRAALATRDTAGVRRNFEESGLPGVALHLGCSLVDALDVVLTSGLLPAGYRRRGDVLRRLVELGDVAHVSAADTLGLSRWTVATYRRDLGLERTSSSRTRSCT
jgi:hypothetical protein